MCYIHYSCKGCTYRDIIYLFSVILGRSHYLLFTLAAAMQPRMLVTFDEELNPLAVPVRVGLVSFRN